METRHDTRSDLASAGLGTHPTRACTRLPVPTAESTAAPREGLVTGWSRDPQLGHGAPQLAYTYVLHPSFFGGTCRRGSWVTARTYRHTWVNRTVAALIPPAVSDQIRSDRFEPPKPPTPPTCGLVSDCVVARRRLDPAVSRPRFDRVHIRFLLSAPCANGWQKECQKP